MSYYRTCPQCKEEIKHKNKASADTMIAKDRPCRKCAGKNRSAKHLLEPKSEHSRPCPMCNEKIYYTEKSSMINGDKRNTTCDTCRTIDEIKRKSILNRTCKFCGNIVVHKSYKNCIRAIKENSRCAKCPRKKRVEILKKNIISRRVCPRCSKEIFAKGPDNVARSAHRLCKFCAQSIKPPRTGLGNGCSGWYMGNYFRSTYELNYIVNFLPSYKIWESAENNKFRIEYTDASGKIRNYYPDFFVDNKFLIEIKPAYKQSEANVLIKKKAAEEWCLIYGYEYMMIDPGPIEIDIMLELYDLKIVKFLDHWERKIDKKYPKEKR